jgi:nucleotide-binding universal stress UspA family protein
MLEVLPEEFRSAYDPVVAPRGHLDHAEAYLDQCEVNHKGHILDEHPASAILGVAEDVHADLIVVGSRGLGRARRILRGSVSSQIASHASTSFMVIHDHEDEDAAA